MRLQISQTKQVFCVQTSSTNKVCEEGPAKKREREERVAAKGQRHGGFPGALAPQYYPRPRLLNFANRTGYGVFRRVWPLANDCNNITVYNILQIFDNPYRQSHHSVISQGMNMSEWSNHSETMYSKSNTIVFEYQCTTACTTCTFLQY